MNKTRIYLDYNATAPLRPAARTAMLACMDAPHNASSVHSFGREGKKILEDAREQVASLVGAPPAQVIFNSGATEGNNTVLRHFANERVLVSAIEHPSVLDVLPTAEKIPVTSEGIVDVNALEKLLQQKPGVALVSVMLVNNETGAIQNLREISAISKRHGALVHCDAAQAAGRIPLNLVELGPDFLTLSSHKIGGPQGAGALVLGLCGITPSLLKGGGQEKFARSGTENLPAIAGFGAAASEVLKSLNDFKKLEKLRDKLEQKLGNAVTIHAAKSPRVANTSMFSLPGAHAETLLMALDLEGVAVSNGSACSSGTVRASHVLKAMGAPDDQSTSALRVSMGWATNEADIDGFIIAWEKITARLQDKKKAHA
jgi:cysteine desulfurase